MRATRDAKPARDVLFVASSGHELGHLGIDTFIERRPGLVPAAKAWIHLGANIGAAQGPGNNLQASDDEMETMMAEAMAKAGLRIDRRLPRGAVPRGEAENVHRGGGRYISIIGNNDLFHNTIDRGVDAVDLNVIERFASAFAMVDDIARQRLSRMNRALHPARRETWVHHFPGAFNTGHRQPPGIKKPGLHEDPLPGPSKYAHVKSCRP